MIRSDHLMLAFLLVALLPGCGRNERKQPEPAAPAAATAAPSSGVFDPTWAQNTLWDDGMAEVALYRARRPQYGKPRTFDAVMIVVKEDLDARTLVKADLPEEGRLLLPVLKFNLVQSYWTESYPYHFLTSVFVHRDDLAHLAKLANGSQEWCGVSYQQVKIQPGRTQLTWHTYFDREADGSAELDLRPGDLFEDQLPLTLRALRFTPGLRFRTRLMRSLVANKLGPAPAFPDAEISVSGPEPAPALRGRRPSWKVDVSSAGLTASYWFSSEYPNQLLQMRASDGREMVLKEARRARYWQEPTFAPSPR